MPAELVRDENDALNVGDLEKKIYAWNIVQSHATFQGIVTENPQDSGACAPFDQAAFTSAIEAGLGWSCAPTVPYTCAINLAWVNFFWSATFEQCTPCASQLSSW